MEEVLQAVSAVVLGGAMIQAAALLFRVARQSAQVRRREALALEGFVHRARRAVGRAGPKPAKRIENWTGVRKFSIERKVREAAGVYSFYLKPHDGKPLPPFVPGQYLTVEVAMPGKAQPQVRCYSLSDAPGSRDFYRITVKRIGEGVKGPGSPAGVVSTRLHELPEGATINVRAPSGQFFLDVRRARPVVLIAGGIGITPLLSMLNTICNYGLKREVYLFYGVRDRNHHALYDHLQELRRKHKNFHLVVCYSRPTPTCKKGRDYDHKGHVTVPLMRFLLPFKGCEFYLCGPGAMIRSITEGLKDSGVPEVDIKMEAFGPASLEPAAPPLQTRGRQGGRQDSVKISFQKSGKTLDWSPAARSLLDLAETNGVSLNSGCRAGQCGS
ncbi:MAG: FAD-binding oxidoreductase, partial [Kiloniellales bacterium]|nr:FAD-binding oxidoreductase [Kiloniellales bacterium]